MKTRHCNTKIPLVKVNLPNPLEYQVSPLPISVQYLHLGFIAVKGGDNAAVISAGLPNITGECYVYGHKEFSDNADGVFTASLGVINANLPNGDIAGELIISFDASRYNPIYGSSITVQPPAIVLLPQIKY